MNVVSKLRLLPTPAKIAIAAIVAVVLGLVGWWALGDVGAGAFGLGGIFSAIGALFGSGPHPDMAAVLREKADRLDQDADRARDEAEARARLASEARADAALETARVARVDDGDDLNRVYERDTRPSKD